MVERGCVMKVLVLDDDEDLTDALCQILSARNLDVHCTPSASQAIEMLKENEYDLVLLDYTLPQHDGAWFLSNALLPRRTKVLLITGHIERKMINTMFKLGACGYIIKPFDEEELIRNLDFFFPVVSVFDRTVSLAGFYPYKPPFGKYQAREHTAVNAAGVQSDDVLANQAPKCCPVTEND